MKLKHRNLDDVKENYLHWEVLTVSCLTISALKIHLTAVKDISGRYETESSGGITLETIRSYAECGVDFISVGALTHHIKSLDMSLKAI